MTASLVLVVAATCLATPQAEARTTTVSCPSSKPWIVSNQAADGRFPAHAAMDDSEDSAADLAPHADDLRVTALVVLDLLADGSTTRRGPSRAEVRAACRWLVHQQDAHGRLGLRDDPRWLLDHALASYALCEAARLGPTPSLFRTATSATAVLGEHVRRGRPSAELVLWHTLCARSLAAASPPDQAATERESPGSRTRLDAPIDVAIAAPVAAGRDGSAWLLLQALGDRHDPAVLEPVLARNLAYVRRARDPLAQVYLHLAVGRLGSRDVRWLPQRQTTLELAAARVAERRGMAPALGSWDPLDAIETDLGRLGTAAAYGLLQSAYYRCCRLEPAAPVNDLPVPPTAK